MSKKNGKEPQPEKTVSILTVGETQVGKTSLILRFIDRVFYYDTKATIGIDYMLNRFNRILTNLDVFPETMLKNMDRTYGLI